MSETKFKFDEAIKELEDITAWFESSEVDLDAGLAKFERGMELAAKLKDHLATIQNRVETIKVKFGDLPSRIEAPTGDDDLGLFE